MNRTTLEAYKKAIKEKYEVEKLGRNAHFLLQPSRAKLRDFCFELFKENSNASDLHCFQAFLGFEFSPNHYNKLKALTDKFRPLETFFKGETDLMDLASVDMAAFLVDFSPRPYLKFAKIENAEKCVSVEMENSKEELLPIATQILPNEVAKKDAAIESFTEKTPFQSNSFFRKPFLIIGLVFVSITGLFGYRVWNQKECMQWNTDHYEIVSCKTEQIGLVKNFQKVPLNEPILALRKITVSDTTTFFKHEKPIVWYYKKRKTIEFYNNPGFHPENGKPLKPITKYMIDKYVFNK